MKRKKVDDAATNIVRTTLRVPRHLWTAARHQALEEGIPVQDLVIRALTAHLKKGGR
jgi:predicted DNA binding CopG/RHH family protein